MVGVNVVAPDHGGAQPRQRGREPDGRRVVQEHHIGRADALAKAHHRLVEDVLDVQG